MYTPFSVMLAKNNQISFFLLCSPSSDSLLCLTFTSMDNKTAFQLTAFSFPSVLAVRLFSIDLQLASLLNFQPSLLSSQSISWLWCFICSPSLVKVNELPYLTCLGFHLLHYDGVLLA